MSNRKDKQARRLARKRKAQRRQPSPAQDLLFERVRSSEHFKDVEVVRGTGIKEKMSDVILHFAEPLQDEDGDIPAEMIDFAIFVWNASLMSEELQKQALKDLENRIPRHDRGARQELRMLTRMLLDRKATHFADNKRMIFDYQIDDTAHSLHLKVVSTPPEGYQPG